MRSLNRISICLVIAVALCAPQLSLGQYLISSVAGGGPNHLPELQSSIGFAGSVVQDAAGNTYISDSYTSQVFEVSAAGTLTIFAGNGTIGYTGDGGPATNATLRGPEGLAVDSAGDIFIADTENFVIREVVAGSGIIQTVAGNGTQGYSGDGNPATKAELNDPYGVFVDVSGNIFIADTDNFVIREVVQSTGDIQTVAGNATPGYSGDGGPATSAELDEPEGVFVDAAGNIFIADTDNSVVRVVNPGSQPVVIAQITIQPGDIETVAGVNYDSSDGSACVFTGDGGPATSAYLCEPSAVFVDGSEDIFIADTDNFGIREVVPGGTVSTVAGTLGTGGYSGDGGPATGAELNYPSDMFVDGSGDIYIADTDNFVIREVTAGTINTVIGNGTQAYSGDGGIATDASLNAPGGVFSDAAGDIFIADSDSSVIREVLAANGNIQTVAGNGTACVPNPGCGDNGLATSAELNSPGGVFLDSAGDIFIADTEDSAIREVVAATGDIQTVAGTLGPGGYSGDGGPATGAELQNPNSVVVDGAGNIFIADTGNSAVRVVNTGSSPITIAGIVIPPGDIQTVAGTPPTACTDQSSGCGDGGAATSAQLNSPAGIALDATEDIFIADTYNDAIREVNASTGIIETVAGTIGARGYSGDNGPPTSADLDTPSGVNLDGFGDIFIADTENSVVREVVAVTDLIQTVAGTSTAGFSGDGRTATSAELNSPLGLAGGPNGSLFFADTDNFRIRELASTVNVEVQPSSSTLPLKGSQQFAAIVTGARNTSVTWQVNGATHGNATVGTISSGGLYVAPANVISPPTVRAISNSNGFTLGSVKVNIAGKGSATVDVSTSPSGVTEVYTGTTQTFNATVTGESSSSVNWEVNGVAGGNSTIGTISTTGVYSSPTSVPSHPLVIVTALSQSNPAVSGSYPFTVVTVPSASQPAPQGISPGGTAKYALALDANTGSPSQPITLSCLLSTLPAGSTCTFTPAVITPSSQAVPFALAITVPAGTSSLQKSDGTRLAQQVYLVFMPLAGILLMGGKPRNRRPRRMWFGLLFVLLVALNGCGGGSSGGGSTSPNSEAGNYTVAIQGTTVAQPNPVTITTAGLTVQ